VGTSTGHGTILERTSKFERKRAKVIVNQSTVNRGLMRKVQNWLIEGSR
jgi:UDP-glucose 6-dehydrogenase